MTDAQDLPRLAEAQEPRAGLAEQFFVVPGPGITEVLIIRHAQVLPSHSSEDVSLTDTGREQARTLADYLARQNLDAVFSSPARRALETAAAVAEPRGVEVKTVAGLRDIDTKFPVDRSMQQFLANTMGEDQARAVMEKALRERSFDALGELVEPGDLLRRRRVQAIDDAIERHPGGRLAVVTHGPVIMAYLASMLQVPYDMVLYPRLTSISVVLARGEMRSLLLANALPHFGVL